MMQAERRLLANALLDLTNRRRRTSIVGKQENHIFTPQDTTQQLALSGKNLDIVSR